MADEQTTVSMSLARYEQLRAFEKSIKALSESKRFLLYYEHYQTVYLEGDEITEQLINDVQRMEKRVNRIRDAIREKFPTAYTELNKELWF